MNSKDLEMLAFLVAAICFILLFIADSYLLRNKLKNVRADLKSRGIKFTTVPVALAKWFRGRSARMFVTEDKLIFLIKTEPFVVKFEISNNEISRIDEIAPSRWQLGRPSGYTRTLSVSLAKKKYRVFLREEVFADAKKCLSEVEVLRDKLTLLPE